MITIKKTIFFITFILFIINSIVIYNTTYHNFGLLNKIDYYNIILYLLCFSILTPIISILNKLSFLKSRKQKYQLFIFSYILVNILLIYCFIGIIWDKDPRHTILFYPQYWNKLAIDFPNNLNNKIVYPEIKKQWAYVMADIIIRCYSFIILVSTMIICPIICLITIIFTNGFDR
jgi:hypothetical protein